MRDRTLEVKRSYGPRAGAGVDDPAWSSAVDSPAAMERGPREWRDSAPAALDGVDEPVWASPRARAPTARREDAVVVQEDAPLLRGSGTDSSHGRRRFLIIAGIVVGVGSTFAVAAGAWLLPSAPVAAAQRGAPAESSDRATQPAGEPGVARDRVAQVLADLSAARAQLRVREEELRRANDKVRQLESEQAGERVQLRRGQQALQEAQDQALRAALGSVGAQACEQRLAELQRGCGGSLASK